METIVYFKMKDRYSSRHHYAYVVYNSDEDIYILVYKYQSMTDEYSEAFPSKNQALFKFYRVLMFLLS